MVNRVASAAAVIGAFLLSALIALGLFTAAIRAVVSLALQPYGIFLLVSGCAAIGLLVPYWARRRDEARKAHPAGRQWVREGSWKAEDPTNSVQSDRRVANQEGRCP